MNLPQYLSLTSVAGRSSWRRGQLDGCEKWQRPNPPRPIDVRDFPSPQKFDQLETITGALNISAALTRPVQRLTKRVPHHDRLALCDQRPTRPTLHGAPDGDSWKRG